MDKFFTFIILTLMICASHAQIYKWVDSQGNVHFSDIPQPGAEIINIPDMPVDEKNATSTPSSPPVDREQQNTIKLKPSYKISIIQPEDGATIRNNQGFVKIVVQTQPDLSPNDKVQLLYDGTALGEPQKNLEFEVNDMNRGAHTFAVEILDHEGNVITISNTITTYVFRPRVGMVPGTRP